MTKLSQLSARTIVLQPGSSILRVGLAADPKPTILMHCISRKFNTGIYQKQSPMLSDFPLPYLKENEPMISGFFKNIAEFGNQTTIQSGLTFSSPRSCEMVQTLSGKNNFLISVEGFKTARESSLITQWPIRCGKFNPHLSPTAIAQDLEDIWGDAVENYLGIARDAFSTFSVILVIEDVFVRGCIRHMINVLLNRLKFARVLVQQTGVCATYGVGLPSACVVDIGAQKTSVSCVDEGISQAEARVTLPVGSDHCLGAFKSLLEMSSATAGTDIFTKELECLDCNTWSGITTLVNYSTAADNFTFELLRKLNGTSSGSGDNSVNHIRLPFRTSAESSPEIEQLNLPGTGVILAHLAPFSPGEFLLKTCCKLPAFYQPHSTEAAPEPDDPFDDMVPGTAGKEKKRKLQGQPDVKSEENMFDANAVQMQKPSSFGSLAEAILWSVDQMATLAFAQATQDLMLNNGTASQPLNANPESADSVTAATTTVTSINPGERAFTECQRRMMGCILLVGGGASGLGGFLLERRLAAQLSSALKLSEIQQKQQQQPAVEVLLRHQGVADLAWQGAKLMLTADSITDLWITHSEWLRFGSRLLRERAPFLW